MIRAFASLLKRDSALLFREPVDSLSVLVFFVLVAVMFPLGLGLDPVLLQKIAAGVVWVAATLSALLSLQRLFTTDLEDGSLAAMQLGGMHLPVLVLAKALTHWLAAGLPLVILAPVVALLYGLPPHAIPVLVVSLMLGTPSLSLAATLTACLTLGARGGALLAPLLALPLFVPILIFGAASPLAILEGIAATSPLLYLGAMLAGFIPLTSLLGALSLQQAIQSD